MGADHSAPIGIGGQTMLNSIRNIIGVIVLAIAAIPFCVAAIILTKDMRDRMTMDFLRSYGGQTTSKREKLLVRMALGYMAANRDDVNEAYEYINDDAYGCVIVDGSIEPEVEEEELQQVLDQFTN